MNRKIVVTDLTRFKDRSIVCLAGIDPDNGECIRPLDKDRNYLSFESIKARDIHPGALLEGDFRRLTSSPPHTEDYLYVGQLKHLGHVGSGEFRQLLANDAKTSVSSGFGKAPPDKFFLTTDLPQKSIITLKLTSPSNLKIIEDQYEKTKIKAHVTDGNGLTLSFIPITDLGFSDHAINLRAADPDLENLNRFIRKQTEVYVRLGLGRAYTAPNKPEACWIQLNGIYTFPEYRLDIRHHD